MALFKSKSATAAVSSDEPQKVNLQDSIKQLSVQIENVFDETTPILDDSLIPQPVKDGFAEVAKMIGFAYDSKKHSTLYLNVKDDGSKRVYGPTLKAFGDSVAIVWSKEIIPLPGDTKITGSNVFQIIPGENGAEVMIDITGYCFPVSISFLGEYVKGDAFESFKTKLFTLQTAEDLSEYLNRAETFVKWGDIPVGASVTIASVTKAVDFNDGTKVRYNALAMIGEDVHRISCPGKPEQWEGVTLTEPIVLMKQDAGLVVGPDGTQYVLGAAFKKLAELYVDGTYAEYSVVGYKTGRSERFKKDEASLDVVIDGAICKVNGNSFIVKFLKSAPEITQEKPATLVVKGLSKTKNDHDQVSVELRLAEADEPEHVKAMRLYKAKMQAERQLANAGTVEPF